MALRFAELMFTPAVKAEQERHGSRQAYARMEQADAPTRDSFGTNEAAFIAERDSFYMASVTSTGWPYMQHRGGPRGFLKLIDDRTLGFADFKGNRQYISLGNLETDDRVALFMIDYPKRRRLKILGHARAIDAATEPELLAALDNPGYDAIVEHGFVIALAGFDWNCPKHITPRFTESEVDRGRAPSRSSEGRRGGTRCAGRTIGHRALTRSE